VCYHGIGIERDFGNVCVIIKVIPLPKIPMPAPIILPLGIPEPKRPPCSIPNMKILANNNLTWYIP
jgi:hypothetical protein